MVTVEQFSRIIAAVHDSPGDAGRWDAALALIRTTLGGTGSGLILGGNEARDVRFCSVPDADAMAAYQAYYRSFDYVMAAVDTGVPGLVRSGASLVALNPRSEFNADWMRPHGMDDGLFVRITTGPRPCSFLVAAPRRDDGFASDYNVRIVNALVPHLRRALHAQEALTRLRSRTNYDARQADSYAAPAAVVGEDLTVTYANSAFESLMKRSTDILSTSGGVRLATPSTDAELRRVVAGATRMTGARTGDVVRVPRSSSTRPLIIHVLPLGHAGASSALLIVVDPDAEREPPKNVVRRIFSLTNAEADVALRISRGQNVAAIADELSLTVATIKTHLQHVYDKTDTHRQAELVRLLLALMP